jgi:signal peptide peptidase SppA
MERFGHLATRLFNTPLAIHPKKACGVMAVLADRMGYGRPVAVQPAMFFMDDDDDVDFDGAARERQRDVGYDLLPSGIARIQVEGTLVQKLGSLRPYSGMTGYSGIRQAFLSAVTDRAVKAILLDIDSPGGEVSGCFDLVDAIYEQRGRKPIWSVLNENAYSAAYAIASAADYITVPRTGGVGSVGVICMHVDFSRALDANGLKVSFITYGDRKADGHPEIPLSDEALANLQADIDMMGQLFVDTVARNRGVSASKIRDMQAACYLGGPGVGLGLADAVMAPDAAFRALQASLA